MVLTYEQADRYYTLINALLGYANDRFDVVEDLRLPIVDSYSQMKASLIGEVLWDNVGIIDDFVKENPFDLPERHLETALTWKNALSGTFSFMGVEGGRALLMHETGVFAMVGIQRDPQEIMPLKRDMVSTTLLPFDDCIVYDGMLNVLDIDFPPELEQARQDDFRRLCAQGVVSDAAEFVVRAREANEEKSARAIERLMEEAERDAHIAAFGERLPAGFHRGALAGLSEQERESAIEAHVAERSAAFNDVRIGMLREHAFDHEPTDSLEACLGLCKKAELESLARMVGVKGCSKLRKSELARVLADVVPSLPAILEGSLLDCSPNAFAATRKLAEEPSATFRCDQEDGLAYAWPLSPYTFLFVQGDLFTALAPAEVRGLLAAVDFDALERERAKTETVIRCAEACAALYGAVSLDDAYLRYREFCPDPIARRTFVEIVEDEAVYAECGFGLWECDGVDHLVEYTLSDDFALSQYVQAHSSDIAERIQRADARNEADEPAEQFDDALAEALEWMEGGFAAERENLEEYRRYLLEAHEEQPPRPLEPYAGERDVFSVMLDAPASLHLRAFLDERVPDDEDDYFFADRIVEALALGALQGSDLQDLFSYVFSVGIAECCEDDERLPKLITNVYNATPSWENNGWSPQELLEQLGGKRMFFNEKGDVMKIGRNDPCPCGSGKKYKKCCGR